MPRVKLNPLNLNNSLSSKMVVEREEEGLRQFAQLKILIVAPITLASKGSSLQLETLRHKVTSMLWLRTLVLRLKLLVTNVF